MNNAGRSIAEQRLRLLKSCKGMAEKISCNDFTMVEMEASLIVRKWIKPMNKEDVKFYTLQAKTSATLFTNDKLPPL